jgi:hypothetical protein
MSDVLILGEVKEGSLDMKTLELLGDCWESAKSLPAISAWVFPSH